VSAGISLLPRSHAGAIAAFTKSTTQKKIRLATTIQLQDREMVHSAVGRAKAIIGAAWAFLNEP
jgi:hypothetical protein